MTSVLKSILLSYQSIPLCKFRSGNHQLPIEIGRWENIPIDGELVIYVTQILLTNSITYLTVRFLMKKEKCTLNRFFFYKRPNILKFRE